MSNQQGGDVGQAAKDTGKKIEHGAHDTGKKIEHGAHDAASSAQDAGNRAQDKASSGVNKAEKKADRQGARSGGGKSKGEKDNLKVAGAAVAVAAALVFGGVKVYKSRQQEDEPKKVEEKTGGAFGWFNKKADHVSKQADNKAPDAKNKAAELTDNVVASVKGAAENTKSGLNDAAHNVSSGTKDARNKIGDVGVKIEDKGLKASRDSDRAVRDAYFNAAERANRVGDSGHDKAKHGKEKGGNIFDAIGNWFNDRKDDASNAAGSAKRQVQDTGKKAKK